MDDVVVKTRHVSQLVDDLREIFASLRAYDIRLNSEKCVFGVPAGKLLGFIVSHHGIQANPAKIRALSELAIPTQLPHVQNLARCMVALRWFIPNLGEKALPLYRLLKKTKNFKWTEEAMTALEEINTLLDSNPILAAPYPREPMSGPRS